MVPSRQRAVAVRLAHTRSKILAGSQAWASCDVLPFSAWLERQASQARYGALQGRRRLGAAEEWLLWREAALEACAGVDVLQPASLADALRRSAALVRDWGLRWSGTPTSESSVLARSSHIFERRCQALQAYSASDWPLILREPAPLQAPLLFAGCGSFGVALRTRLRELGAVLPTAESTAPTGATGLPTACITAADELRRAARWCRDELQRSPAARLLVVIPQLAQRRAAAVLAFDHELGGGALLGAGGEPLYAIEGGRSLAEYPLVSAALALLRLCGAALEFRELAALLRSSYIGCGALAQRAELELALRERNVHAADYARLCELARRQRGAGGESLAGVLDAAAPALSVPRAMRASAAGWARRFAELLETGGWPGLAPLGSDEQQQRDRFRALLGELALLGAGGASLGHGPAVDLLAAMAQRTSFEAASADVPVTLTDAIDEPLVKYAGIWVAGLGADQWPPPPRPDSFVPIAAQRAAGIPEASPQGQWVLAQQAMSAWRRCADALVFSWPESDGEIVLQPSSLVAKPRGRDQSPTAPEALVDPLLAAIRCAGGREPRPTDRALAWRVEQALPGGTRPLQLQSLCPFRAAAELRLRAAPVSEPVPGLDRFERGQLLHRALQLVWLQLRDSRTLRAMAAEGRKLQALVLVAGDQALRERLAVRAQPLAAPLAQNELLRLTQLIGAMLQQEQQRRGIAEFAIAQLEEPLARELGGIRVCVRMDRLDRLDDGRVVVIDYKSGAAESFQPLADRPRQPQLLAYALLAAGEVAGVAAVHLNADAIRWRGAVAENGLLPALARARGPTAPWPALLAHWRTVVDALVRRFVAGDTAVDPQAGACRNCHLPALCRVEALRQHEPDPDAEDAGEA